MPRPRIRMSLIDGGLEIRRLLNTNPNMPPEDAIDCLRRGPIQNAVLDFEDALDVAQSFGWSIFRSNDCRPSELRGTLRNLILSLKPAWSSLIPYGRNEVFTILTDDEYQCFNAAGLVEKPPSEGVVAWWDEMATALQREGGENLVLVGRIGEKLTLEYEERRLKQLGIQKKVIEWVAVECSNAGYDVLSWDLSPDGYIVERMIEVKTCLSGYARFFLTRNEWSVAKANQSRYFIYYWEGDPLKLGQVISVPDLLPYIPEDNDVGKWVTVEVSIAAFRNP